MLDVRFSSALKVMLLLGHAEEEGSPVLNSTQLARSLNTNPSLVRKLMVPLVQDALVASIKGRSGCPPWPAHRPNHTGRDLPLIHRRPAAVGPRRRGLS